jgi:hypothetical protein
VHINSALKKQQVIELDILKEKKNMFVLGLTSHMYTTLNKEINRNKLQQQYSVFTFIIYIRIQFNNDGCNVFRHFDKPKINSK